MFITIPILIIIVRVMMMMMINTPKKADHVINKAHGDKTKVMDQENFKYVG